MGFAYSSFERSLQGIMWDLRILALSVVSRELCGICVFFFLIKKKKFFIIIRYTNSHKLIQVCV